MGKKKKGETLMTVSDNIALEAKQREERERKYPNCTALSRQRTARYDLMSFLEWLRDDKKLELAKSDDVDRCGYLNPVPSSDNHYERLVLEYLEIDVEALEKERAAMIAEVQGGEEDV